MAAGNPHRQRYQEYTNFLRASAAGLNIQVAPARLERLRSQVSLERNKFLFWLVSWLLIAMVSLVLILMPLAVQYDLTLPPFLDTYAERFHDAVVVNPDAGAVAAAVSFGLLFVFAVTIAYIPIIANSDSLNDLESAHRALKDIDK